MEKSVMIDFHDYIENALQLQEVDTNSYSPQIGRASCRERV